MSVRVGERRAKELANRILRAGTAFEKMAVLDEVAGFDERHRLLWSLVRKGHLRVALESSLWPELAASLHEASTDDVISLFLRIRKLPKREAPVQALGIWPLALDEIACRAYAREHERFDALWKIFPAAIRRGFKTMLRRAGKLEREDLPRDLGRLMAQEHVLGKGLHSPMLTFEGGEACVLTEIRLSHDDELGLPTDDFYPFVELFCTREKWNLAVLEAALDCQRDLDPVRARDAFRLAERDQLVKLLRASKYGSRFAPVLYERLLEDRRDTPEDLLHCARELETEREYIGEQCAVVAVTRLAAAKEEIPAEADRYFNFRSYFAQDSSYLCLDELVLAFRLLPKDRRRAILMDRLEHPQHGHAALALIQTLPEPEIMERGVALVRNSVSHSVAALTRWARALATIGPEILPQLEEVVLGLDAGRVRDGFVRAILFILGDQCDADRDYRVDSRYDCYLQLHGHEGGELRDHTFTHDVLPTLVVLLRRMPEERCEVLLIDAIDPQYPTFTRPFACLEVCPTTRVLEHAFDVLVKHAHKIVPTERDWVRRAVEELGEAAEPHVERALQRTNSAALRRSLQLGRSG